MTETHDADPSDLYRVCRALEVSANTLAYCYANRPGNFAQALESLQTSAEDARNTLARYRAAYPDIANVFPANTLTY